MEMIRSLEETLNPQMCRGFVDSFLVRKKQLEVYTFNCFLVHKKTNFFSTTKAINLNLNVMYIIVKDQMFNTFDTFDYLFLTNKISSRTIYSDSHLNECHIKKISKSHRRGKIALKF